MPIVGEIVKGSTIGKWKGNSFLWQACSNCGKERWVQIVKGLPTHTRCKHCGQSNPETRLKQSKAQKGRYHREKSPRWKGGFKSKGLYILVLVEDDSPYISMANYRNYVPVHRLVVAQSLGRCLHRWEIVHHINGIKHDNRLENLLLIGSQGEHNKQIEKVLKEQDIQIKRLLLSVLLLSLKVEKLESSQSLESF